MKRSPDLEKLVEEWFDAATRGDGSVVDRYVPDDDEVRLIGSDPGERVAGGRAVAEFLRGEVGGAGGNVRFTPSDLEAFEEGDVGWALADLTISLPDGAHVTPRWTSVFRRRNGSWEFVLTHASIAVPNERIGWIYAG